MECNVPSGSSSKTKGVKKSKGTSSVKLSTDPQSVAARERRHRISDRFKILQSMVPGGSKMDTVSMLEEAIHYVKFLKTQILFHQTMINFVDHDSDHHEAFSPMFLPNDNTIDQHNVLGSVESGQNLQQLPLEQFCFQQGDEDVKTMFNATRKY
ncbi:unnamed protein product [Vicia faba]|uniref:BHLH domain-containing protein n=1 Tax=Vicia faba TaxID=3906 RepID=A0AAV1ATU2_VICFA|nr:unnamed protein product [Vicia faba]